MIMMHSEKSAKLKVPERDGTMRSERERYMAVEKSRRLTIVEAAGSVTILSSAERFFLF